MATKAQLIDYADANGVAVDDSMLKADIEQALRDAGHDPDQVGATEAPPATPTQQEDNVSTEPAAGTHSEGGEVVAPEDAYEKGWWGSRPEVFDDAEFTLETGPNSPGLADLEDPENYDSSQGVVTDEMPTVTQEPDEE